jgi:hypothetical protein
LVDIEREIAKGHIINGLPPREEKDAVPYAYIHGDMVP